MLFGAFNAQRGKTQKITTSAVVQSISLNSGATPGEGTDSVRVVNFGTNMAFIRVWNSKTELAACTVADVPILPNTSLVLYKEKDQDSLSALWLTGATDLYVSPGSGGV